MQKHLKYLILICQAICLMPGDVSGSVLVSERKVESTQEDLRVASTLLRSAAKHGDLAGTRSAIELLKSQGRGFNRIKDELGGPALLMAAGGGHEGVVLLLLDSKVNIEEYQDTVFSLTYGATALHIAAGSGHEGVVRLLLGRKANINAKNDDRENALYEAVKKGNKGMVQLLLESNADIETQNDVGSNALDMAAWYDRDDISLLLIGCYDCYNRDTLQYLYEYWQGKKAGKEPSKFFVLLNERVSNAQIRFEEINETLSSVLPGPRDLLLIVALFMGYDPGKKSYFPLSLSLSKNSILPNSMFNREFTMS